MPLMLLEEMESFRIGRSVVVRVSVFGSPKSTQGSQVWKKVWVACFVCMEGFVRLRVSNPFHFLLRGRGFGVDGDFGRDLHLRGFGNHFFD